MKKLLTILVFGFLVVGCDSGLDREKLRNDVMDVHDAIMGEWTQLKKLKGEVLKKAAELAEADSTDPEVAKLRDIAGDLDAAYELMSTWMKDWGVNAKPYEAGGTSTDEASKEFFASEQERVNKMEEQIMKAFNAAKDVLK